MMRGTPSSNAAAVRRFCTSLLVGTSLLLQSCGGAKTQADLVFANAVEPQTLDPAIITGQAEGRLASALFEGLLRFSPAGRPEPGVAESYSVSEDGKTYTFKLRPTARWSNGEPVTSQDFFASWERVLNPDTASEYSYQLHYIRGAKAYSEGKLTDFSQVGIRTPDPSTFVVELENPTPFFPELCAFVTSFPVHVPTVKKYGDDWLKPGKIVTNGSFLLKEWKLNNRLRLEKSPIYWDRESVKLSTIDVLPITNANTAYNFYHAGMVDLIMDKSLTPLSLINQLRDRPDFHASPYLGNAFFRFNTTVKPFDDVRVRRAFCMAVDKKRIVTKVTRSGEIPARSFVPPGIPGYEPYLGLEYNPEKARALLAEAGFQSGEGFPLIDYQLNESPVSEAIAIELKDMFAQELGVQMNLRKEEWKVYLSSQSQLKFMLSRSNWVGDYADPNTFLDMFITGGGNNRTGWSNKNYDALIEAAARELDPAKRFEFFRQAEKLLVEEDVPICPLYYPVGVQIYDANKIGGIEPNVLDEHPLRAIYRK